jgi:hypothetical protein
MLYYPRGKGFVTLNCATLFVNPGATLSVLRGKKSVYGMRFAQSMTLPLPRYSRYVLGHLFHLLYYLGIGRFGRLSFVEIDLGIAEIAPLYANAR